MLAFTLGLRFYRSKRYGALARFMSFASITGIAVGVFALIVGLSAMNGFEYELKNRVLSVIPAAEITSNSPYFVNEKECFDSLLSSSDILAVAPVVRTEAVLNNGGNFAPIALLGVDPKKEPKVIDIERFLSVKLDALNTDSENEYGVILGEECARWLNLLAGDSVKVILSNVLKDNNGNPLSRPADAVLKVVGTLKIGGELDASFALISIDSAKSILDIKGPNSFHIKVKDMLNVRDEVLKAAVNFPQSAQLQTWMTTQGKLYHDIQMIRSIMNLVMLLVMAVASFNIVSNLIMAVSEKSREIAVLLTAGATRGLIIRTFTVMGVISGACGTFIGVIVGCILSLTLTPVLSFIESIFNIKLLNPKIYFIDFIPSQLLISDVIMVACCALCMSFIASLYPAVKASKIKPAQELCGN
ncbi:lipoprotein-releasing ABC transporter permease subunit [Succinatimonas hippei]|uniref:lipoprotein-releasing ABC transporter permease subunit n=1 Tax=Succinatimonas hippei TaxID=626938 RepID=UPI00248F836B|nr:lipoprotein-releasing ABC transporter permease subunit [Succinatimonas hippei]